MSVSAWPSSAGSRSPAQEVQRYAPKSTKGRPLCAVATGGSESLLLTSTHKACLGTPKRCRGVKAPLQTSLQRPFGSRERPPAASQRPKRPSITCAQWPIASKPAWSGSVLVSDASAYCKTDSTTCISSTAYRIASNRPFLKLIKQSDLFHSPNGT